MVASQVIRRITKELVSLQQSPPDGVRVIINETDLMTFQGWVQGPPGTPYEGGYFSVSFDFDRVDFPAVPPVCKFATKIFHPNVSRAGDICVSTLKKDWKPEYGIERILVTIKCLLIAPNPESALDSEASRILQEAYDEYSQTAQMWTSIYASRPPPGVTFSFSSSSAAAEPLGSSSALNGVVIATTAVETAAAPPVASQPIKAKKPAVATGPKRGIRRL